MPYAQVPGEVPGIGGVCHPDFPPGHVRRYANGAWVHDAANIVGTCTTGSNVITGISAAHIALCVVGQRVVDVHDFATNFLPEGAAIASVGANSVTLGPGQNATGTGARNLAIGTTWEGITAFFQAVRQNALHPGIEIDFGVGDIAFGWNMGFDWSGTAKNPCKVNFNKTNFWGILHWVQGLSYAKFRGEGGSYDRIGISAGVSQLTLALSNGSTVINVAAGSIDNFSTTAVGAIIICEQLRTSRAEIIAKMSASQVIVDVPATASGNFAAQIASNKVEIETVIGKHDKLRNMGAPGRGNRGAHIVTPFNLKIGRLIQEGCDQTVTNYTTRPGVPAPGGTPLAAVNAEISGGRNFQVGEIWVQDSLTHGLYIVSALDMDIGQIRIDGAVGGGIQMPDIQPGVPLLMPESDGLAQSTQGKDMWINRCTGRIRSYVVRQKREPPSGAEFARVMFDETGRSGVPSGERYKPLIVDEGYVEIGSLTAGTGTPIHFGDPDLTTPYLNIRHGPLVVLMREGHTLEVPTYGMININGTNASTIFPSQVHLPSLTVINPGGALPLKVLGRSGEKKEVVVGLDIIDTDIAGKLLEVQGHAAGDLRVTMRVQCWSQAGSITTAPLMLFDYVKRGVLYNSEIGGTTNSSSALRISNSEHFAIRDSKIIGFRGSAYAAAPASISLANNVNVSLDNVKLTSDAGLGYGILLDQGTHGRVRFSRVDAELFQYGFKKHASATIADQILFEQCHAINCTTPTDLSPNDRVRVA